MVEDTTIMKYIFILAMIVSFCVSYGQKTKRIVKYFHESDQIMEEYDVLESNENIKHGEYFRYYRATYLNDFNSNKDRYIQKSGYYYQNKKDSNWTYFKGHRIKKEEYYKKGEEVGIWKTYLEKGKVVKQYDQKKKQEVEPLFNFHYIYPDRASDKRIEGLVEIYVKYNVDCTVDTIYVKKNANIILDESALFNVREQERIRAKYSLFTDCSEKSDSTYVVNYKLRE